MAQVELAANLYQNNITAQSAESPDEAVPAAELSVSLGGPNMDNCASAGITLSGTFVATLQFEASGDGGNTWDSLAAVPSGGGAAVTSAAAPGLWQVCVAGLTNLRVRCSAFTSQTNLLATIKLSTAPFVA
jgi:hypothetical protein